MQKKRKIYAFWKRFLDIFFSLLLIILLIPFFVVISIIVAIDTRAFPVFRQNRIGRNKRVFKILKFRSMKKTAPQNVSKEHFDDVSKYITKFGKFIRKTSIDELPQLFNIFIGNMSFVGPRPILWNCNEWIEERDKFGAHNIRPGITGLAQCNGRDTLDIKKKSEYDGYYYQNMCISLDIKIVFKTIKVVLTKQGVVEEKQG